MSTKTCKGCGWVYPASQPGKLCKLCGTPFDLVRCSRCKNVVPVEDLRSGVCKKCHAEQSKVLMRRYRTREKVKQDNIYNELLDKIKRVPKNYPTLTEKQWIEACGYFHGCALCGSEDIDSRCFLVSFELGGRYCDWNILPMCERCAGRWKGTTNPLARALTSDYTEKSGTRHRDNMTKILKYVGGKLDDANRIDYGTWQD